MNLLTDDVSFPPQIVCKTFRVKLQKKPFDAADVAWYSKEIHKLLDELFYVPVWRSEEDVMQPIIGKPFSPKSPPVYPLVIDFVCVIVSPIIFSLIVRKRIACFCGM